MPRRQAEQSKATVNCFICTYDTIAIGDANDELQHAAIKGARVSWTETLLSADMDVVIHKFNYWMILALQDKTVTG